MENKLRLIKSSNLNKLIFFLAIFFFALLSYLIFSGFFLGSQKYSESEEITKKLLPCVSKIENRNQICLKNQLKDLVVKNGPGSTLETIKKLNINFAYDLTNEVQCHNFSHILGSISAENSKDYEKSIIDCDNSCSSGCFHGFFEVLAKDPGKNIAAEELCEKIIHHSKQKFEGCLHALGHYVGEISSNDMVKSSDYCSGLEFDSQSLNACYSGVFMQAETRGENFKYLYHSTPELPDENNYMEFCENFNSLAKDFCIFHGGSYIYRLTLNPKSALNHCSKFLSELLQPDCIKEVAGYFPRRNNNSIAYIIKNCEMNTIKNSQYCLEGAIFSLKGAGQDISEIEEICTQQDYITQKECQQLITNIYNPSRIQ